MTRMQDYIERKKIQFGNQFDSSDLDQRFVPYFNSRQRIKVYTFYNEKPKTGTVGITSGFRPVFLLMLRSTSTGSSFILDKHVKKIEVLK